MSITGVHTIMFARGRRRASARSCATCSSCRAVDAGGGWLIFALPPAELAAHPSRRGGHYELYLMCDDLDATMAELEAKGVEFTRRRQRRGLGPDHGAAVPGGGELGLYEPRHPTAI